jgi:hypothetical protein
MPYMTYRGMERFVAYLETLVNEACDDLRCVPLVR